MSFNINMPNEVIAALNLLNNNGFEAYIVGGCVRDILLGKIPHDWDITTSAKPEEISRCFHNYRTINTGLKHGTVTVLINKMQLEVTTYRIDGKYSDNRRPDNVIFTDKVVHDLQRRDFTINALAYNHQGIVDMFCGIDDIKNKVVKCVGDPDERFNEDGLRILRAMRFASVLDFKIEKNTSLSIHKNKKLLNNISKERIGSEFNKLLSGTNFFNTMMEYKDVVEIFIDEVKVINEDEWKVVLNSLNYVDDLKLKLALLLYKTNNAEGILKNLKYDGKTIKFVKSISTHVDEKILPDKINIKKQLSIIGYDNYINLLKFKTALFNSQKDKYKQELICMSKTQEILEDVVMNKECYDLSNLEVSGEDLIEEGFSKGITLGSILNEILNLVIEEKLENNKKTLIDYAKNKK